MTIALEAERDRTRAEYAQKVEAQRKKRVADRERIDPPDFRTIRVRQNQLKLAAALTPQATSWIEANWPDVAKIKLQIVVDYRRWEDQIDTLTLLKARHDDRRARLAAIVAEHADDARAVRAMHNGWG